MVYDLRRDRVIWVGRDRTTATLERFFAWLGPRRARSIHTVCCDMWAAYLDAVRMHRPQATIVFDRFHVTRYRSRAVAQVLRYSQNRRRSCLRRYALTMGLFSRTSAERRVRSARRRFSGFRSQRKRVFLNSALSRPCIRRQVWRRTSCATTHSRLGPFKKLVHTLRTHLEGVLAWTRIRVTNGALEGMNNKIKAISHRAFGYRRPGPTSPTSTIAAPDCRCREHSLP